MNGVTATFHRPHGQKEARSYQVRDVRRFLEEVRNNSMKYKGYSAHIEYSEEDKCLVGHIAGITDIVGFHADTVPELQEAFEEAVEDYLETCEKLNKPPQKPYSGNLRLRIPPDIHVAIAKAAEASGKDLNQWVTETFSHAVNDMLSVQSKT